MSGVISEKSKSAGAADLREVVTEALMGMIASITSTTPPPGPPPPFIQSAIDRAIDRIGSLNAPRDVPEGWRLVPVEPSMQMRRAAQDKLAAEGLIVSDWLICTAYAEMLDAPSPAPDHSATPRPTGLSRGWNLVRQCDGFVIGHGSDEPSQKHKDQALADGRVYVPFLVQQANHVQGARKMVSVPRELLRCYLGSIPGDWVEAGNELRALLAGGDQ